VANGSDQSAEQRRCDARRQQLTRILRSERAAAPERPRDLATRGDEKLSTTRVGDRIAASL
jgi:hypothetical protein